MKHLLLVDTMHPAFAQRLISSGYEVHDGTLWSREKILQEINRFDGIAIRSRIPIDKNFIDQALTLKFIARAGAGMESIDVTYAQEKNILCISSPEGNRDAVAEHAMGLLLNLLNHISKANKEIQEGKWIREANRGIELGGKTVGIIGYGNTGMAFAKRLAGFDVKILAYDKFKKNYADSLVKESRMEELYADCDVVSLHIPLNKETLFMANHEFFQRFKKNIFFLNTARGKIAKTADLLANIESGKIRGAGLDVNEYEDSSFEKSSFTDSGSDASKTLIRLFSKPNVLFTPHIAGWTHESNKKIAEILAEKILISFPL